MFLSESVFTTVVEHAPLVSLDLCLVCQGDILLGNRANEPLKGEWFTPGGRIIKNESWQNALERIALSELGLSLDDSCVFKLMGVWDHFYPNSMFDEQVSTHYVNLPHVAKFESKRNILGDAQHSQFEWFDLEMIAKNRVFHKYVRAYACYLTDKG
jgi:colanic acid biosynthesis protein WcaH